MPVVQIESSTDLPKEQDAELREIAAEQGVPLRTAYIDSRLAEMKALGEPPPYRRHILLEFQEHCKHDGSRHEVWHSASVSDMSRGMTCETCNIHIVVKGSVATMQRRAVNIAQRADRLKKAEPKPRVKKKAPPKKKGRK